MNSSTFIRHCAMVLLTACAFSANSQNWQITSGTKANFTIDGMMGIDVNGTLTFSNATIVFDPTSPNNASMNVVLTVASIATGIGKRDKHLKSEDYFDATKFPAITFKSSAVQKSGNGYKVTGNLRIKDVTKVVTIPFSFEPEPGNAATFKGSFTIERGVYHVGTGKENGMGNEVRIRLNVPVRKA